MKISAVILTGKNINQKLLKKCIASVSWCDEIVRVDTSKIKGSFSDWRNEGIKRAKGEWIFYIDSDEEATEELRNEILEEISNNKHTAYAIPRRNFIFGKEFKHSGQYPDYQKRLFLKSRLVKWEGRIHEEPYFEGDLGHLKNPLIHRKDITISQMVEKTNEWSEMEADLMLNANHPKMNALRFVSAGGREFWKRMIVEAAFLDGAEGVIYALYQVFSKLVSYTKLWEKQVKKYHGEVLS